MNQTIRKRIEDIKNGVVPEGYKKTKAGLMPVEWVKDKTYKAKDVFYSATNKKHNGQFEVLSATQDRGVIPRSQVDIDIKYNEESVTGYKKVDEGDFVISLRSFQGGIEYSEYEGLVSPAYTVLKNKLPISKGFYKAYLKTNEYINRLNKGTYGIRDGKQVGFEDFGDMVVHYPPLAEQEKIADILETQDKVIKLKEKLIEQKKQQKKYLMQQLLTGKKRLPGVTVEWNKEKLKNLSIIDTGNADTQDKVDGGEYPFYIRSEIVERINSYTYDGEAILTPGDGKIGEIYHYVNGKFNFHQRVYKISDFRNCSGKYIYYYLALFFKKIALRMTAKATVDSIRREMLTEMIVNMPSIEEQRAIADVLSKADEEIELLQKDLEEEKNKKKALMQLLLTGIVRVVQC